MPDARRALARLLTGDVVNLGDSCGECAECFFATADGGADYPPNPADPGEGCYNCSLIERQHIWAKSRSARSKTGSEEPAKTDRSDGNENNLKNDRFSLDRENNLTMMIFINGTTARRDIMIDQPRSADTQTPHACRVVRKNGRRIVDCDCDILRTTAYNPAAQPSRPWDTLPNWHVTWAGSASSDGAAPSTEPGQYPANEDGRSADCVVAPGAFVTAYCQTNDPEGRFPNTPADAVRAWARQQGFYCA